MQLYTYQRSFMTKFSMVSARLDIELLTSQQRLREVTHLPLVIDTRSVWKRGRMGEGGDGRKICGLQYAAVCYWE